MRARVRELTNFEVPEAQRGHGIGTALLQRTVEEADKNAMILMLMPDEGNDRLFGFYERFGFRLTQSDPPLMLRAPHVVN